MKEKIENAVAMADNLMNCLANEQYLGQAMAATAQAIRDLADVCDELRINAGRDAGRERKIG